MMKIVGFADTHGGHGSLHIPDGDMLVFAGDYTGMHSAAEFDNFIRWMASLPHPFKIFMPGNHDWFIQWNLKPIRIKLQQLGICCPSSRLQVVGGLKVYGMPLVPQYGEWAFMVPDGSLRMRQACRSIPEGLDILVTHGPAHGILGMTKRGVDAGSHTLREAIDRAKPRLHFFGHIHEAHGMVVHDGVIHANVSVNNHLYYITNQPIVIELP
jgi:predicted phosphohydrolase